MFPLSLWVQFNLRYQENFHLSFGVLCVFRVTQMSSTLEVKFISLKVFSLRLKIEKESEIPEERLCIYLESRHRREPRTKHLKDSNTISRRKDSIYS